MSKSIITTIRMNRQVRSELCESQLHTFIELAHLASFYGIVKTGYDHLSSKSNCSRRTAIRHIALFIALGFIQKTMYKHPGKFHYEINTYKFLIPLKDIYERLGSGDTLAPTLPPQEERGKNISLQEEKRQLAKGMQFWTPGSEQYLACLVDDT